MTLDDDDPGTPAVAVPATVSTPAGPQSFTATIPGADLAALSDGPLTASLTCAVGGSAVDGAGLTLRKDTVAPDAPTRRPGRACTATRSGSRSRPPTRRDDPLDSRTGPADGGLTIYDGPILVSATRTLRRSRSTRRATRARSARSRSTSSAPTPVTIADPGRSSPPRSPPPASGRGAHASSRCGSRRSRAPGGSAPAACGPWVCAW